QKMVPVIAGIVLVLSIFHWPTIQKPLMSFLMVMVDVPVCSPPISGGRCILLVHFQVPAMSLSFAISAGGFIAPIGGPPAAGFLPSDLSCASAGGAATIKPKAASEAISFIRSCLRQCIATSS